MQKSYQHKSDGEIKFLTFITVCKSFKLTFLGEFFAFIQQKISIKFCVFTQTEFLQKMFGLILILFANLEFVLSPGTKTTNCLLLGQGVLPAFQDRNEMDKVMHDGILNGLGSIISTWVDIWTSFTRQQVEETGKDYIFTVFMVCNT
jgi:hypothetical protein